MQQPNGGIQYNFSKHSLGLNNNASRAAAMSITQDVMDLDQTLKGYEATIEKQREQIKHQNEKFEQQQSVFEYEKQRLRADLTKQINLLKNQRQVWFYYDYPCTLNNILCTCFDLI